MRLYNVDSTVAEFDGYRDVNVRWFVNDREVPAVPYAEGIRDYRGDNAYSELALDELFALEEAEMLAAYLKAEYGTDVVITETALPLPAETAGLGALAVGGRTGFIMLNKTPGYSLPFEV